MSNVDVEVLWFDKEHVAAQAGTRFRELETGIVWEAEADGSWTQVATIIAED